jgi:hypothetical protein
MTDSVQFSLRIPKDLEKQLRERTKITRRSRNAEIIHMIESLFEREARDTDQAIRALERNPPRD